jgi:pyruvate kinase
MSFHPILKVSTATTSVRSASTLLPFARSSYGYSLSRTPKSPKSHAQQTATSVVVGDRQGILRWRSKTIDLMDLRLNEIPVTGTMTKVVCTLGPATDQPDKIQQLIDCGLHVARLNFSHAGSDYTYPTKLFQLLRNTKGHHEGLSVGSVKDYPLPKSMSSSAASALKMPVIPNNLRAILVDTKGPEIRTGVLPGNEEVTTIATDSTVILTTKDVSGLPVPDKDDTTRILNVDYQSICTTVSPGDLVLLDDGLIALEVMEIEDGSDNQRVICTALNAGPIKKNKGVNLPGNQLDLPALTDKDKQDLKWACEMGADFVAASFIRTGANVRSVIAYLNRCVSTLPDLDGQARLRPLVISKIENKEGVDNFDEILEESDGIMVARGDLGVEIPYSKVFAAQKMMVEKCNLAGKPVIVATQMLDSMIRNPRPTRAEVTDVGTAVLDGADAVMLSGETAAGSYPIESIKSMASVVVEADIIKDSTGKMLWSQSNHDKLSPREQELDGVAASAVKSSSTMNVDKILLISKSGRVARAVARHKPPVPVLAFCTDPQVARRLQLHRGVTPIMLQSPFDPLSPETSMGLLRAEAIRTAKELGFVKSGDRLIIVDQSMGKSTDMHEVSHNMKVITLRGS